MNGLDFSVEYNYFVFFFILRFFAFCFVIYANNKAKNPNANLKKILAKKNYRLCPFFFFFCLKTTNHRKHRLLKTILQLENK